MLHVSARLYADSLHTCDATARRRLRGSEFVLGPHGEFFFPLSVALPTVRPSEFRRVADLVKAAVTIPAAQMPDRAGAVADRLEQWANSRHRTAAREFSGWGKRIQGAQRAFAQAVADGLPAPTIARQTEHLRRIILLDPAILRYVFADEPAPPDWSTFCINFALRNAAANIPHQPTSYFKELYT